VQADLDSLETAYITCIKPINDGWSFYGERDMNDLMELEITPLPTGLSGWNNHNLTETYYYTKRQDLKSYIASEVWWRTEIVNLQHIGKTPIK